MARLRTPTAKAEVSGAAVVNPARFNARKAPKKTRPIGEPYAAMTELQREAWAEFKAELPWLNSSQRPLVRLACIWMAKLDADPEGFGVSATQVLSSILSKLGATPVDESKVNHGEGEEADPADKFFAGRPH